MLCENTGQLKQVQAMELGSLQYCGKVYCKGLIWPGAGQAVVAMVTVVVIN